MEAGVVVRDDEAHRLLGAAAGNGEVARGHGGSYGGSGVLLASPGRDVLEARFVAVRARGGRPSARLLLARLALHGGLVGDGGDDGARTWWTRPRVTAGLRRRGGPPWGGRVRSASSRDRLTRGGVLGGHPGEEVGDGVLLGELPPEDGREAGGRVGDALAASPNRTGGAGAG